MQGFKPISFILPEILIIEFNLTTKFIYYLKKKRGGGREEKKKKETILSPKDNATSVLQQLREEWIKWEHFRPAFIGDFSDTLATSMAKTIKLASDE